MTKIPNSKLVSWGTDSFCPRFGHWILEFGACLKFAIWNLVLSVLEPHAIVKIPQVVHEAEPLHACPCLRVTVPAPIGVDAVIDPTVFRPALPCGRMAWMLDQVQHDRGSGGPGLSSRLPHRHPDPTNVVPTPQPHKRHPGLDPGSSPSFYFRCSKKSALPCGGNAAGCPRCSNPDDFKKGALPPTVRNSLRRNTLLTSALSVRDI